MTPLTFSGLGTSWWVELFHEEDMKRRDVLNKDITALLVSYEERYSRFRPDSLISQLNTTRIIAKPDSDLQHLLTYGQELHRHSRGLFNMLLGTHLDAIGYNASYSFTPTDLPKEVSNPITDLIISPDEIILKAGSVDIGGYGKGLAIDGIANILRTHGIEEFLINGGGDMYGTSEHGKPITLYLEHPTAAETYLGTTTIFHQGFAASSPHKRRWKVADKEYSHIVGGAPLVDASFIIAKNAVIADVFATVALLASPAVFAEIAHEQELSYLTLSLTTNSLQKSEEFPYISL